MNFIFIPIATVLILFSNTALAERQVSFTGTDIYGTHIRALGMGNAFTAVAKTGDTALDYNPAGLATTYDQKWGLEIGLNADASFRADARKFAEDLSKNIGKSSIEKIDEFVDKYKDDTQILGAQVSGFAAFQMANPFKQWTAIDRIGFAGQRFGAINAAFSFPKLSDRTLSSKGKSDAQVSQEITNVLSSEYAISLSDDQKDRILSELGKLDPNDREKYDKFVNLLIQRGVDARYYLFDNKASGLAISTLKETLKVGATVRQYDLETQGLSNFPLAKGIATKFEIRKEAETARGSATSMDLGGIYTFKQFLADWRPQLGVVWQNLGGADFGKDTDTRIVPSFNVGFSMTKSLPFSTLILATDITDLSGNYYRTDIKNNKHRRTFQQRFHAGAELGVFKSSAMEHHYLYVRTGLNQGQGTMGFELAAPWNIMRLGYVRYGVDNGDEDKEDKITKEMYYLSLGFVI